LNDETITFEHWFSRDRLLVVFKTALGEFAIFGAINKPRPAVKNSWDEVLSYGISKQRIKNLGSE